MLKTKLVMIYGLMFVACDGGMYTDDPSVPEHDVTLRVTHHENSWTYTTYTPDTFLGEQQSKIQLISGLDVIKSQTNCPANTQNAIKIPAGKIVRLLATSNDNISGVCLPQYGVKMDAIPGRINEVFFTPIKAGTICGTCLGEDGKLDKNSTIVLEIVEKRTDKQN